MKSKERGGKEEREGEKAKKERERGGTDERWRSHKATPLLTLIPEYSRKSVSINKILLIQS